MTAEPPGGAPDAVPTMACRVCETDVPAGAFCGYCGGKLSAERGDGRGWLRIGAHAAAAGEHVLRLSVASSLYPHLPHRSRIPFRVGLAVLVVALVAFAALRWQAAMIAVTALGLPVLFLIYLYEADAYHDLPIRTVLLTAALGAGLGAGWARLTGTVVARSYDVALDTGLTGDRILVEGLAVPVAAAVLMLVPAVLVRVLQPPTRESLDGFLIGSLGAICFTAATTLTLLAPQFTTGPTAGGRSIGRLLIEAGIRGTAMPLTAAALGGMFGAALWFTPPRDESGKGRRLAIVAVPVGVVIVVACYAGLGVGDVGVLADSVQLGLHLLVAVVALLALRIALQAALLHEAHDTISASEPLLCPHCGHVVPDMAFCPNCGVATRASSRSSRTMRRLVRPARSDTSPGAP